MQQTRAAPPAILEAVLERITYANEQTGYTVARVATERSSDLLTRILEQPSLPGIASCGSVNPFAPKPAGALRSKGRGDLAVHERAMVQAVRAALRPCLTPRDRDAADPAGQGRYGSTTVPPAPRCSRVQRTGPCKRWLDSARTVARNGMWVRRSVAIGNQPGLDSLFENPS
jgi:hypothetical protein